MSRENKRIVGRYNKPTRLEDIFETIYHNYPTKVDDVSEKLEPSINKEALVKFGNNNNNDYMSDCYGNKWDRNLLEYVNADSLQYYCNLRQISTREVAKAVGLSCKNMVEFLKYKRKYMLATRLDDIARLLCIPTYKLTYASKSVKEDLANRESKYFPRYSSFGIYKITDKDNPDKYTGYFSFVCDNVNNISMIYSFKKNGTHKIINVISDDIDNNKIKIERCDRSYENFN